MTGFNDLENELMHARVYDPVKAHEYYLRTRHLKGRRRSSADISSRPGGGGHQGGTGGTANTVLRDSRSKDLDIRIEDLQDKVDRLRALLRERVDAAKKRAGVDEPDKKETSSSKTKESTKETKKDDKPDKPLTEKEKREKREASKEQYDKENRTSKVQTVEALERTIKTLRERLEKLPKPANHKDGGNGR